MYIDDALNFQVLGGFQGPLVLRNRGFEHQDVRMVISLAVVLEKIQERFLQRHDTHILVQGRPPANVLPVYLLPLHGEGWKDTVKGLRIATEA